MKTIVSSLTALAVFGSSLMVSSVATAGDVLQRWVCF